MIAEPPVGPKTSVIIPALRPWSTLPAVLDALRPQIERPDREALLVESSADFSEASLARRWPWLRVKVLPEPALPGKARNVGAQLAYGERLVFLDADCVPAGGWLDALENALTDDLDAVSGAILNGTPHSPVGTAGYLLEFSDWIPQARRPRHAASCNMLIRRRALEARGGFAEDVFPGEDTILTVPLAARGRLAFVPHARVRHLNRCRLGELIEHQVRLGRAFVRVGERSEIRHRWLGRPGLAPVAGPLRALSLAARLARRPRLALGAIVLSPLILVGLGAWTLGLASGGRHPPSERAT